MTADLFERARAVGFEAVAAQRLFRVGARLRGPCVLCGSGAKRRGDGPFSAEPTSGRWNCFSCGAAGDVIALEQALRGGTMREAAERLAGGDIGPARPRSAVRAVREALTPSLVAEKARARAWAAARPIASGDPADCYLHGRGIAPAWREGLNLRVHRPAVDRAVMLAQVVTEAGPTGGLHLTYLVRGRSGRWVKRSASGAPAKRMIGPQSLDGRPGGVWLHPPQPGGPCVVAEGIETALSAAAMLFTEPYAVGVAAALSLDRLQGGWAADRFGRRDAAAPRPDPERRAFTWPGLGQVIIAVDRDMAPIRVAARGPGGRTVQTVVDGEARARVCAALAAAAWTRAGAGSVRVVAPPPGQDCNDQLKELAHV